MEGNNMKGSEKQIVWATEIKENLIRTLETVVNRFKADPMFDPKNPIHTANLEALKARIDAANDCESAAAFIDCFGQIHFNGDMDHDLAEILAVYRAHSPNAPAQHQLLVK
jgi:hypothetical protein